MEATEINNDREGKVITFYSYKGGVGRSMALANIAVLLAKAGKKVLVVDWDLEAPGIDRYFRQQQLRPPENAGGLLHLLTSYPAALESLHNRSKHVSLLPEIFRTRIRESLEEQISIISPQVSGTVTLESGHTFDVLPSGEMEPSYSKTFAAFSWGRFFAEFGADLIEALRHFWRQHYDFVLVDSRTGVTDAGGICTVQLPDSLVFVFSANDQNLEGGLRVIDDIHRARAEFGYDRLRLMIVPLLSRFDGRAESLLSGHWLARCADSMQPILDEWLPKHISALEYFDKTKLPHIPRFAFGEQLAVLHERETDPDTLTFYYSAIARLLAGNLVRPERLLALPRQIDDTEKADILARASEQRRSRETIRQIEQLIGSLPSAARAQAEQLRAQIRKLATEDDTLREDLEAIALNATTASERTVALDHLNHLPGWTQQDTLNLQSEIGRRRPQETVDGMPSENAYVFVSYAQDDESAARRLIDGLTAKGVAVWHDRERSKVDRSASSRIAHHIANCRIFVPIISQATNRVEGYYREEWKQAVERLNNFGAKERFIWPVVIDTTNLVSARIPSDFLLFQSFSLPEGQLTKNFLQDIRRWLQPNEARVRK
jgi:MinD-like ATPase involved in chromosome partitioning or flagellar assembly